jgi:hypothetical protein
VAARLNAPVIGAEQTYAEKGTWSAAFSWRYQKSDRHFVGSDQQNHRQDEGSEVINWVHQLELAITRTFSDRFSVTVGIPYLMAVRSQGIRDPFLPPNEFGEDPVVRRTETHASGMGDLTVVPRRWMFAPATHSRYNLSLGLGAKIPTGEYSVHDTRQIRDTTPTPAGTFQVENVVRTVDQSIQPGDGGFGVIVDAQGFYRFAQNAAAAYAGVTYLLNPAGENGVATYRGEGEEIMSVPDQYLYRAGTSWFPTQRVGVSLGLRWEGIPVHDVIGDSDGFRRPGYAFSIEPGFSYTKGPHTFSLLVPVAAHRNREKNVPDLESSDQEGGDAAFADYVILGGYIRRF